MHYTWDHVTGPHEIGHTGGLKHPQDDYKGYFFDLYKVYGPTYNSPENNFMRGLRAYPTGVTRDQIERIYRLYKAGKLNSKDNIPVYED